MVSNCRFFTITDNFDFLIKKKRIIYFSKGFLNIFNINTFQLYSYIGKIRKIARDGVCGYVFLMVFSIAAVFWYIAIMLYINSSDTAYNAPPVIISKPYPLDSLDLAGSILEFYPKIKNYDEKRIVYMNYFVERDILSCDIVFKTSKVPKGIKWKKSKSSDVIKLYKNSKSVTFSKQDSLILPLKNKLTAQYKFRYGTIDVTEFIVWDKKRQLLYYSYGEVN